MIGAISNYATSRIQTALNSASAASARDVAALAGASGLSTNDTAATAAGALGLASAMRNAHQATAFAQYGDETLGQFTDILQNLRELAVRAASETFGASDRVVFKNSAVQLASQAAAILNNANFNGVPLFQTSSSSASPSATVKAFQVGADATDIFSLSISAFDLGVLGGGLSDPTGSGDSEAAKSTMDAVDGLMADAARVRSGFGTAQVIMESRVNLINSQSDSLALMWSGIDQDVMMSTTTSLAKNIILTQSSTALLAQANTSAKDVLILLAHSTKG